MPFSWQDLAATNSAGFYRVIVRAAAAVRRWRDYAFEAAAKRILAAPPLPKKSKPKKTVKNPRLN